MQNQVNKVLTAEIQSCKVRLTHGLLDVQSFSGQLQNILTILALTTVRKNITLKKKKNDVNSIWNFGREIQGYKDEGSMHKKTKG